VRSAGAVYLPERLHDVRIAVKKLRYAIELRADAVRRRTRDVPRLRTAQDALGRLHDLQVLIHRCREAQASLDPPVITAWRELGSLVDALEEDCRALHARYVRQRRKLIDIVERMSDRAARSVPATHQVRSQGD
jgi:CHAD domain-containing protein